MSSFRARVSHALVALTTLAAVSLVAIPTAQAATCDRTWTGGSTGLWSTSANWSGGIVAGSSGHTTDNVCIPAGSTVTLDVNATVASINTDGSAAGSVTDVAGASTVTLLVNGSTPSNLGTVTLRSATVDFVAGANVSLTGLTINGGTFVADSAINIGSGGLDVEPTGVTQANVGGTGTMTVAGDVTVLGSNFNPASGVGISLNQTGTHAFTLGTKVVQSNTRYPQFDVSSVNTPNDIHVNGSVYSMSSGMITTTGNFVLAAGSNLTAGAQFTAAGVTIPAGGAEADSRLTLNGSTSSLGGNFNAPYLTIDNGGSLFVPAGIHLGHCMHRSWSTRAAPSAATGLSTAPSATTATWFLAVTRPIQP